MLSPLESEALGLSLRVACWSVVVSLPFGLAAAWLLARREFVGKNLLNGLIHLPLVVPENCLLRVGNQERAWEEGKLLIFDDSVEHEARNGGKETRIVLLFDIWRPELTEEERVFVATVFSGITAFDA